MNSARDLKRLGRHFWFYKSGQMISTAGDICGNIALVWWILEATGSAGKISTVLGPAILVQTLLTPVLGPLGDRFSRTHLIIGADMLRCLTMIGLAGLASAHRFTLPSVLSLYVLFSIGSAIFNSNNMSSCRNLFPRKVLPGAMQTSQSLEATGRVIGGLVAGIVVSWAGVTAAFVIDAASFAVATLATLTIVASAHVGKTVQANPMQPSNSTFISQLKSGWKAIYHVPLLFWLCVTVAFFNLVFSPMQVLLPTFAKQVRGMPAWFLGGLESSIGVGMILGALGLGMMERIPRLANSLVLIGLIFVGSAITFLAHLPGVILPLTATFFFGAGAAWTNIPISTRMSIALPDHFRSRVNSIIWVFSDGITPFGIAAGGLLASSLGVKTTMTCIGITALLSVPVLFWIPGFVSFFRRPSNELEGHFLKACPEVFMEG